MVGRGGECGQVREGGEMEGGRVRRGRKAGGDRSAAAGEHPRIGGRGGNCEWRGGAAGSLTGSSAQEGRVWKGQSSSDL